VGKRKGERRLKRGKNGKKVGRKVVEEGERVARRYR
jgi:predicted MarR family transcription regulator